VDNDELVRWSWRDDEGQAST